MRNNNLIIFGIIFGIFLISLSFVSAFAVSSQYWKENPVSLYPGQSTDIYVDLQNVGGEEDLTATVTITQGSDIAEIIDESNVYFVPIGERIPVNIRITIPSDTEINGDYTVTLSVTASASSSGGPLGLGSGVEKEIPVKIIEKPKTKGISQNGELTWWVYVIIIAILIALIIIILVLIKKRSKSKKSSR